MEDIFHTLIHHDYASSWAYITNGKHLNFYASVRWTLGAALFGGILALFFGLIGAMMKRANFIGLRIIGNSYTGMVRGIPDVFFLIFFPLAFEIGVETVLSKAVCSTEELGSGKWPPCQSASWVLTDMGYFILACISLGIVYGAFCANVIFGALQAVPKGQLEAANAYGMARHQVMRRVHLPQMWVYALPGLSNVWLLLLKATSLLSLLQIADIVQWAGRLGAPNYFASAGLVHGDWRWRYYLALFVFYILLTLLSEKIFVYLNRRASKGMAIHGEDNA